MQKLVLTSGKTVPVKNVTRWQNKEMIEISISNSELIANNLELSEVLNLLKDHVETAEMKLINDAEVVENVYYDYSKLDSYNVAYDQVLNYAGTDLEEDGSTETEAETNASKDTIITVSIKKLSDLGRQVANNTEMVEAVTVAIASMMGE